MIEYINNPALLLLACEVMLFLISINFILLFLVSRKNNKVVNVLNTLVAEIKEKSEENKSRMTELLLQPDLIDPEAIKQGMQNLVNGQTQLYKDIIKAIRTQNLEDVSQLGESVSHLIGSAVSLGRESGEGSVDKEAQARLETENQDLQKVKGQLENKLEKTAQEMESLMKEYKGMMDNVSTNDQSEENNQDTDDEIIDITSGDTAEELIDITSEATDVAEPEIASTVSEIEEEVVEEVVSEEVSEEKISSKEDSSEEEKTSDDDNESEVVSESTDSESDGTDAVAEEESANEGEAA